jgi:hypothetical protein
MLPAGPPMRSNRFYPFARWASVARISSIGRADLPEIGIRIASGNFDLNRGTMPDKTVIAVTAPFVYSHVAHDCTVVTT